MTKNRWTVVGTATALGVGAAVATASLGGISLADSPDAGDAVVVERATTGSGPGADVSNGDAAVADPSPESADSPTESAADSPEVAPAAPPAPLTDPAAGSGGSSDASAASANSPLDPGGPVEPGGGDSAASAG